MLVEESQNRDEAIPALVYGTTMSEEERQHRQRQVAEYRALAGRQQEQLADRARSSEGSSDYETDSTGEWTEETVTDQPEPEVGSTGADVEQQQPREDSADLLATASPAGLGATVDASVDLSDHPYLGTAKDGDHAPSSNLEASEEAAEATQPPTSVHREARSSHDPTITLIQTGDESSTQQPSQQLVGAPAAGNLSLQQPPGTGSMPQQEDLDDEEGK